MVKEQTQAQSGRKNFFISYTSKDYAWAEWIAMQLEDAGYTTIFQAWDIRPGSNFIIEMDNAVQLADRTIAILSSTYLDSNYPQAEWTAAFRLDPKGTKKQLLPVRIEDVEIKGLLGATVYIDLVGLDEQQAREKLLVSVKPGRVKPASISFPALQSSLVPSERPAFPGSLPPIWNIPYPQNPLFIGREDLLNILAATLHTDQPTLLGQKQAISGLGGIGKTQLALEYAYQHRQDYQAVLWAQANTREALTASFLSIAALLNLPEKDELESDRVITAVKNWLQTQINWLLILDNADSLKLAYDFLPSSAGGHIILTTRAQAMGRFAQRLEVDTFSVEQGMLFLLRRAGLLASDAPLASASEQDQSIAHNICEQLGYLPLALDQAAAYIEETQCSLIEYLHLFQNRRADLLAERRGIIDDHPQSVAATWSLSFQRVEMASPAAADLLRLCAFLAPDAIPESIITKGASHLGSHLTSIATDPYQMNKAIEVLHSFSLLRRETSSDAGVLLSVHRLVQAVLQDQMDEQNRRQWSERTVRAVSDALPTSAHKDGLQWERLLAHAIVCVELVEQQNFRFVEATYLLHQTGRYLVEHVRYNEAEMPLIKALSISEQEQGSLHLDTAIYASTLGLLYHNQRKYAQAEHMYLHALAIQEQQLGSNHLDTASTLVGLLNLYISQGKVNEAWSLPQRIISTYDQQLKLYFPNFSSITSNLTSLLDNQSEFEVFSKDLLTFQEQFLTLATQESSLGPDHPVTAALLSNMAYTYYTQRKYIQAEDLYLRALKIQEQQLGPNHFDTNSTLGKLASFYISQGNYDKAKSLYPRMAESYRFDYLKTVFAAMNYVSSLIQQEKEEEALYLLENLPVYIELFSQSEDAQ